ncbi:MAG TPA: type II and III secretion system protein family protein [Pyrinomonadaceae bacterium]
MHKRSPIARIAGLFGAALLMCLQAQAALGQQSSSVSASFGQSQAEPVQINVLVGQSRVINFDRQIGRFSVSNPEVAEAVLVAPDQVLVNGKAFGQVNFIAWEKSGGQFVVFDVYVRANLSLIDSQMRALFPGEDVRLSQANGSVVMSGKVKDMKTSTQAEAVVAAAGFKTVNMMETPTQDMTQIQLQVRVAEVSRNKMKELAPSYGFTHGTTASYINSGNSPTQLSNYSLSNRGSAIETLLAPSLNLFLGNGIAGVSGLLRALNSVGAVRSLAEPNLIAMNGQQASFLAGGEFPVPMVQSSGDKIAVAVVWKEYGVRLNFKPTIIDEDHIRLELEPEVSTIDFANGVKLDGFLIPALKTRRAKTGVELRDGQSFALAGLLDNNEMQTFSKVPGLGDIPILGHLFRSKSFTKQETELMFIVTAHMVKPMNRDELPEMRGIDGLKKGSPLGIEQKGEGIKGDHGFETGTGATSSATPAAPKSDAPAAVPAAAPQKEEPKKDAVKTEDTSSAAATQCELPTASALPVALSKLSFTAPRSQR